VRRRRRGAERLVVTRWFRRLSAAAFLCRLDAAARRGFRSDTADVFRLFLTAAMIR
jgi:hypothetical protein